MTGAGQIHPAYAVEVNHSKIVGKEYLTHASPVGIDADRISGTTMTRALQFLRGRVEVLAGITFNSVLLNYYQHSNDSYLVVIY